MPNIIITTYCNLKCTYCFAQNTMKNEEIKNISLEKFNKICNYINPNNSNKYRIGIIGGEPTLHPQFQDILLAINNLKDINFILFTNGIELFNYINNIPDNLKILINYNDFKNMTYNQYISLTKTMDKLYSLGWLSPKHKAAVGCNLYLENKDYSFFWEIIDKYKITSFRFSIAVPPYTIDKDKYYNSILPIYLKFVEEAKKRNVVLDQDCNQIPICYFTKNQIQNISSYVQFKQNIFSNCTPVIDITPSFKASSCFGNNNSIDCNLFNNFSDLYYYLNSDNIIKMNNNNTGKCQQCLKHQLKQCQGGCLFFSNK